MTPRPFYPNESTAVAQVVDEGLHVTITCRVQVSEAVSHSQARGDLDGESAQGEHRRWSRRTSWTERRFSEALDR